MNVSEVKVLDEDGHLSLQKTILTNKTLKTLLGYTSDDANDVRIASNEYSVCEPIRKVQDIKCSQFLDPTFEDFTSSCNS